MDFPSPWAGGSCPHQHRARTQLSAPPADTPGEIRPDLPSVGPLLLPASLSLDCPLAHICLLCSEGPSAHGRGCCSQPSTTRVSAAGRSEPSVRESSPSSSSLPVSCGLRSSTNCASPRSAPGLRGGKDIRVQGTGFEQVTAYLETGREEFSARGLHEPEIDL